MDIDFKLFKKTEENAYEIMPLKIKIDVVEYIKSIEQLIALSETVEQFITLLLVLLYFISF